MKNSGYDYIEQVDSQGAGVTVLAYLSGKFRHSTETKWKERLEGGEIFLDGRQIGYDDLLKRGQKLLWRRPPWDEPQAPSTFSLLHIDDDLLAVDKPAGLPTLPAGGFLNNTLLALVRKKWPEATPVHRLGRGTSGIVLFARNANARRLICSAFQKKEIKKVYRALANGAPASRNFSVDAPIGPVVHSKLGAVYSADAAGKPAHSRVRVLEKRGDCSLLEVTIKTGRPHQIRIHLAFAGHPLVGDPLYAAGGIVGNPDALPGDCGYMLHAEHIYFRHPATERDFEIGCCPPHELETLACSGD